MKRITIFLVSIFLTNVVSAQISKTKITKKEASNYTKPYDSLQNFLGNDVYNYLNQDLYLVEKAESLRKYGYRGFLTSYKKVDSSKLSIEEMVAATKVSANVYKCCDDFNSKYEDLKGRYFKIIAIHRHPKAEESESYYGKKYYFELVEKESKDTLFYEYDAEYEHSFPFLVVGFYEKQKKRMVGKEYVFRDNYLEVSTGSGLDILTGKQFNIKTGEKWKCKDLTIEEKYYNLALVIENSIGETTTVSFDSTFEQGNFAYTAAEADKYKNKFGTEKFNLILKGKVKIGMTKEMCELSWGKPKDINSTISSGRKSEQWVYDENYLYFDNGVLTTIQ